jgi:hypothetical protein
MVPFVRGTVTTVQKWADELQSFSVPSAPLVLGLNCVGISALSLTSRTFRSFSIVLLLLIERYTFVFFAVINLYIGSLNVLELAFVISSPSFRTAQVATQRRTPLL